MDIQNRDDLSRLVHEFYKKVVADPVIGPFFTRVVAFSWEEHIPVMISFWDSLLFGTASYKGNPMVKHIELNRAEKMEHVHFEQWLSLWEETIREHFSGPRADEVANRARSIASIMELKIKANP